MSLETYIAKFTHLTVNQAHGRTSPHKICMLLALLDLARAGGMRENRISFAPPLLGRYQEYFAAVREPGDWPNPWFPFFHLKGDLRGGRASFWHLQAKPGRESVLAALDSARSARAILENVDYAYLDKELFLLLQNEENIDRLSAALAHKWFDRGLQDLKAVAEQGRASSRYEHQLRDFAVHEPSPEVLPTARSTAFRRVVTEIYDYRCAATGLRLLLPDGTTLVEAAHIHSFSESHDDDPRNGLALTPNMHWAMDQHLIAPTPDYRWQVTKALDGRIPDHRFLLELKGKPLILPKEPRWYPRRDVLAWRCGRLLNGV